MGLTEGQLRCVETLDRPLVVAAGAGSGKTFTLTERIVRALADKEVVADIDEVCAITFTKKAAGELKSRIKAALRARGLIDQALKVDQAWISTIHGMCTRILKAHAIELGIDPAFRVADESEVKAYLARAVEEVMAGVERGARSQRVDALFAEYPARTFGYNGVSIEKMLSAIVEAASRLAAGMDDFVMPGRTVEPHVALRGATDVACALLERAAEEKKPSNSLIKWTAETRDRVDEARRALEDGDAGLARAFDAVNAIKLPLNIGKDPFKEQVREARGVFGAYVMEATLGLARVHLDTLMGLAREAFERYQAMKRADGMLDNNDLLVLAARALEQHPAIAARYANKFKLVMVDEFQDTDQMQVDMIKRIAGVQAERLCTVGDAQQSIYRFRGADVSVYRRHLASVREAWPDGVIELADNFRSHADVLAFVDRVFAGPEMLGGEFMSLSAARDEEKVASPLADGAVRILVQHTTHPHSGGANSDDARVVAARRIARTFARLRDEGHSASEMALLLGKMPKAGIYAQAMREEGLACVIAGGSVFSSSPEAAVVRSLVRVIANPKESRELLAVLNGPLFRLTAEELLLAGGLSGFWAAAAEPDAQDGERLRCALRVMGRVRASAAFSPVSRLVEQAAVESGWLSRLERQGAEGLACAGNVHKAIRILENIERTGAAGAVTVMRRFEDSLAHGKQAPGALSVSGGDFVRIMTVHASKGLEFPIVAVAEFSEKSSGASPFLLDCVDGKAYLSLDLKESSVAAKKLFSEVSDYVFGQVAGDEELAFAVSRDEGALHRRIALGAYRRSGEEEEAKRLLYVALTRAREMLVVSSHGSYSSKSNPAGIPNSVLGDVACAIDPEGTAFSGESSLVDFGGSAPASVECVRLTEPGEGAGGEPASEGDGAAGADGESGENGAGGFFVAQAGPDARRARRERLAFNPLHQGMFSYSSVADAAHATGLPHRLAERFGRSCDAAAQGDGFGDAGRGETLRDAREGRSFGWAEVPDAGESFALDASDSFDEDRATDLGTAFHRAAQLAVLQRRGGGALEVPGDARLAALAKTCNLDGVQRERLGRALERWFASDVARAMGALSDLRAEVPFVVEVASGDAGEGGVCLEGEIDLFGVDGTCARVVDYKTGGSPAETREELLAKHALQAACYAYAVLLQGFEQVEAVFVRVEQPAADDASQPQCARYRFEAADVPTLKEAIAQAYAMNIASPKEKNR